MENSEPALLNGSNAYQVFDNHRFIYRLGMGPTSTHVSARASGDREAPSSSQQASVTQVAAASRSVAAAAEKRQRKLLVALKNPAGSFQQNPSTSASKCERKNFGSSSIRAFLTRFLQH